MQFRVLGPVEIMDNGRNVIPTASKPRQVMALLILRRNAIVQTAEIIDELWEDGPPASAMTTLQTYIYKVRKILVAGDRGQLLSTRPGGYQLTIPDSAIDLHQFETEARRGRELFEAGQVEAAAVALHRALAVWRGPALVDVTPRRLLASYVTRLEELRAQTLEMRIDADLEVGRHYDLVSELKALTHTQPLHERLHAALMTALHRCGRRHEALDVYQMLRSNMIDELGLEPGRELQQLQHQLLSEPVVDLPGVEAAPVHLPRQAVTVLPPHESPAADREPVQPDPALPDSGSLPIHVPAQLPADPVDFTGRTRFLERVTTELAEDGDGSTATRIVVLGGLPGVGKSALAIHAAHHVSKYYADGQLYADLQPYAEGSATVLSILQGFLRALGVHDDQIPPDVTAASALFRSVTAARRLLIVLDGVSAGDMQALVPGGPRCAVIATSRRRLGVAGAHHIDLDALDVDEAVEMLALVVGADRVAQEPAAAARLVELCCGRLPLAIRCVGSRLVGMPGVRLDSMADQLDRDARALDLLQVGELNVRTALASSYDAAGRFEQGMLRLLSVLPTWAFTAEAAAEVIGRDVATVERALGFLFDRYLVSIEAETEGVVRYSLPAPVLAYAQERLATTLNPGRSDAEQWTSRPPRTLHRWKAKAGEYGSWVRASACVLLVGLMASARQGGDVLLVV
jgi:DNA-binding SARP family transcriptional activator